MFHKKNLLGTAESILGVDSMNDNALVAAVNERKTST